MLHYFEGNKLESPRIHDCICMHSTFSIKRGYETNVIDNRLSIILYNVIEFVMELVP
jgi:hypothetical protein